MAKIFSEAEAAEILKAAAVLQEASGGASNYAAGVTEAELARIATEAGISADSLRAAVAGHGPKSVASSILNLVQTHERVVEGEIEVERYDEVLEVLRELGKVQNLQTVGRSLTCVLARGTMYANVSIFSRNGRTRIQLRSTPLISYFAGLHVPLVLSIPTGVGLAASRGPLVGLLTAGGLLALGSVVFWRSLVSAHVKGRKTIEALTRDISTIAAVREVRASSAETVEESLEERLGN